MKLSKHVDDLVHAGQQLFLNCKSVTDCRANKMIKQDDEETVRRRCCLWGLLTFSLSLSLSLSSSIQMVKSSVRSIPERTRHTTAIAFADSSCGMLFTCSLSLIFLSFSFFLSSFVLFFFPPLFVPSIQPVETWAM
jgi:hypothetical protein